MQLGSDVDHAAFHVSFGLLSLILNPLSKAFYGIMTTQVIARSLLSALVTGPDAE
jgi:hypothetical protein